MPFAIGDAAKTLAAKTLTRLIEDHMDEITKLKPGEEKEIKDELTRRIIRITINSNVSI